MKRLRIAKSGQSGNSEYRVQISEIEVFQKEEPVAREKGKRCIKHGQTLHFETHMVLA